MLFGVVVVVDVIVVVGGAAGEIVILCALKCIYGDRIESLCTNKFAAVTFLVYIYLNVLWMELDELTSKSKR